MIQPVFADVKIEDHFAPAKNFKDIGSLFNTIVPNVMLVAGLLLFIGIVWGGFRYIRSAGSGDAHAAENSKKALTAMIIGFILIFAAYWIVQLIEFMTGTNLLPK